MKIWLHVREENQLEGKIPENDDIVLPRCVRMNQRVIIPCTTAHARTLTLLSQELLALL